jgi:hypothetical protein
MTKSAFDKIKAGLGEAKAYLDGSADKRNFRTHVPARVDVKKIRTRLAVSCAGLGAGSAAAGA